MNNVLAVQQLSLIYLCLMLRPQVNGNKLINAFTDDRRTVLVKYYF